MDQSESGATAPPSLEVDARRLLCPLPILRGEAAMRQLPTGGTLTLLATDPGIVRDLPAWCTVNGYRLLSLEKIEGVWRGVVEK